MYHDRYSRRRAADSFHAPDEEEDSPQKNGDDWSWPLFLGTTLVQVTSRSIWASFGVISAFLLGDIGSAWVLLAAPLAFTVAWTLTEPWVKRLCLRLTSSREFMYVMIAGTIITWFGALISVISPIQLSYVLPHIGIAGGCGACVTATASTGLVNRHFPTRAGAVRFFEHVTNSMSFFLMPILSYYIMDTFGDHGGLLIHSGILMQGLVGGILLRSARWKSYKNHQFFYGRPRAYAFILKESDGSESGSEDTMSAGSLGSRENFEEVPCQKMKEKEPLKRIAFGLNKKQDTPPQKRKHKRRPSYWASLPAISEGEEEVADGERAESKRNTMASRHSGDSSVFSLLAKMLKEPETSANAELEQNEETSSSVPPPPEVTEAPPAPPKPQRVFTHIFDETRNVAKLNEDESFDNTKEISSEFSEIGKWREAVDLETGENFPVRDTALQRIQCSVTNLFENSSVLWSYPWWQKVLNSDSVSYLLNPLTVPAAFLVYATQSSLLAFLALTPELAEEYVEDGSRKDGAYCICVMGFTWLCFVIASPCFSTIHFTNHKSICNASLLCAAGTLYFMASSTTLDEVVLYSSLFGICYGIARSTSHSILKMSFGCQLPCEVLIIINSIAAIFHSFHFLIVCTWSWCFPLRNLIKTQVFVLVVAAAIWIVQGWVTSVRSKRGRNGLTWSRRRRFS